MRFLIVAAVILTTSVAQLAHGDVGQLAPITTAIKAALGPRADLRGEMLSHLQTLRLADASGEVIPALRNRGLREPLDANVFIDRIASCAAPNPYLGAFLKAASGSLVSALVRRPDFKRVIRSAVAYAAVLDRLARATRDDWHLLEALRARWAEAKKSVSVLKLMNLFELAKLTTIELAMGSYVDFHKSGKVPADRGSGTLPLNIVEAVLEDTRLGFLDNARAGMTLAVNPPGHEKYNPRTQAGPTHFSNDKKTILYSFPLPLAWADLYTTWNMAFVSHYGNFPFFFAKLLAPQVLCYREQPAAYIYNRGLALYTHLQFMLFTRADEAAGKASPPADWTVPALTKLWGAINTKSAQAYDAALAKADPTLANKIKKGLGEVYAYIKSHSVKDALKDGLRAMGDKVKDTLQSLKKKLKFW